MPPWHLYLIRTTDGSLYAGITTDVLRRYGEHLAGGPKAAHYLRAHKPRHLVFSQAIGSRSLALKVERRIKRLPKKMKERIVTSGRLDFDPQSGELLLPEQDRS